MRGVLVAIALAGCAKPAEQRPVGSVPFERIGKLMFVDVRVDTAAATSFCIDSGAPHSVIDPRLSAQLGLTAQTHGTITGTGQGSVGLATLGPVTLALGDVSIRVASPYEIDLSKVPIPPTTRGLVGFEIFAQYVVRFDPVARKITFYDPATFAYRGTGARLPLIAENDRLFIDAQLDVKPGVSVTHRLRIDLGSEDAIDDASTADAAETQRTTLGNGLGSSFEGVSGALEAVHLGPFVLHRVWGAAIEHPAIGMEIFRRFVATFDVRHGVLYLEPTAALAEPVPAPTADPG